MGEGKKVSIVQAELHLGRLGGAETSKLEERVRGGKGVGEGCGSGQWGVEHRWLGLWGHTQGMAHELEHSWLGLISNSLGFHFDLGSTPLRFRFDFKLISVIILQSFQ